MYSNENQAIVKIFSIEFIINILYNKMNISGIEDPFYRYKMPKMQTQYYKNNTTQIINLHDISISLSRDEAEIIKNLKKKS